MDTDEQPTFRRPFPTHPAPWFPHIQGEQVLIVIATYNEIDNLPDLVADIGLVLPAADILVIDDNSPDGTGRWCDDQAARQPHLHCIHRPGKLGLGTAILTGLNFAADGDYNFVVNMDADYSHHPGYVPLMLGGMKEEVGPGYDVLIGSRYIQDGNIEGWPLLRHLMSRGVNWYSRWLLKLAPRDCSGGFRCYRTDLLRHIDSGIIRSVGYAFQEEFLWHLKSAGARIGEVPIVFVNRSEGQSKIDLRESLSALIIIGRLGVKNWLGI